MVLLNDLIKRQSTERPDAVALVFKGAKTSYRDLDQQVERWASVLAARVKYPCKHRGKIIGERQGCGRQAIYQCDFLGGSCTTSPCTEHKDCQNCNHYVRSMASANAGIVIGCFGWPRLVELQIKTIRETCGDVPILVCDDCSPKADQIEQVCKRYDGVTFSNNQIRMGHYAGDLSVFRRGVEWANSIGLHVLVKLSQRMLMVKPGWLESIIPLLEKTETVVSPCLEPRGREWVDLYCRTEAVAMRMDGWGQDDVIAMLHGEQLVSATELRINHIIVSKFAGRRLDWPGLAAKRMEPAMGTIWHCSHPPAVYAHHANRFGLSLDEDFSVVGRDHLPNWKRG
jgi:hypothetical protein